MHKVLQDGSSESPTKPKGRPRKDAIGTSTTYNADTTSHDVEPRDPDGDSLSNHTIHVEENSFDGSNHSFASVDSNRKCITSERFDNNSRDDVTVTAHTFPE